MAGVIGYKLILRMEDSIGVNEYTFVSLHKDVLEEKKERYDAKGMFGFADLPGYIGTEIYLTVIDKISDQQVVNVRGERLPIGRRTVYDIHFGEVYAKSECELKRIYGVIRRRKAVRSTEYDEYPVVYSVSARRWYPVKYDAHK